MQTGAKSARWAKVDFSINVEKAEISAELK
jgi:hypothetical protein